VRLEEAKLLADKVLAVFEPFCERVAVAGSIRRGKAEVHDIDFVAKQLLDSALSIKRREPLQEAIR